LSRRRNGETAAGGAHRFDAEELRALAAARLSLKVPDAARRVELPSVRGDHDLNGLAPLSALSGERIRRAAVLIAVIERGAGARVLLTRRHENLPVHAGQVSFPGGKLEPDDPGPVEAALREAEEEIGLAPGQVEVIGLLDTYQTTTGYRVLPVLALADAGFEPVPDPAEVDEVFEVPLSFLMDPRNHHRHEREFRGRRRRYYAMPYGERYIWGATAGMLRNMYDRLYAA